MTDETLEVTLRQTHDGVSPAWVASARGESCGSQFSANDAVSTLIAVLLESGLITDDQAKQPVPVASAA